MDFRNVRSPFAFGDSYGPSDVHESLYGFFKSPQKYFAGLQSQATYLPKAHFTLLYTQNGYQTAKMHSQMRFKVHQSTGTLPGHPFNLADSFGPKDVREKLQSQCHLKLPRKFLKHFEDPRLISENGILTRFAPKIL